MGGVGGNPVSVISTIEPEKAAEYLQRQWCYSTGRQPASLPYVMRPLIVANWKCNPTSLREAKRLFGSVKRGLKNINSGKIEVVICPPFVYLLNLKSEILNLKLGGQDCFWEEKGAFTGEVSPPMLKDLGCQYVILGHSERRRYRGESDEQINKKLKAAIKVELKPILCLGETERERDQGRTKKILEGQLRNGFKSILNLRSEISKLIIAYEPLWAIGTGRPSSPQEVSRVVQFLRTLLVKSYGKRGAERIKILYGGSVRARNASDYLERGGVQGLLVGGASLGAKEFIAICSAAGP